MKQIFDPNSPPTQYKKDKLKIQLFVIEVEKNLKGKKEKLLFKFTIICI